MSPLPRCANLTAAGAGACIFTKWPRSPGERAATSALLASLEDADALVIYADGGRLPLAYTVPVAES